MTDLTLKNVDAKLVTALEEMAEEQGIFPASLHKQILARALIAGSEKFIDHLLAMPNVGLDDDFARHQ